MKISINLSHEVEIDDEALKEAGDLLKIIKVEKGDRANAIFHGMLILLVMGWLELHQPGTLAQIWAEARAEKATKSAKAKKGKAKP